MSKSKHPGSLPSLKKADSQIRDRSSNPSACNQPHQYVTKHRVKQLSSWFSTWYAWQRRVFVCRLLEHCSREQLELLATSLEPILHLDFSTSYAPHLQALHLDGSATFQVQRTLVQSVLNPLSTTNSWACLQSLPTTFTCSSYNKDIEEPAPSKINITTSHQLPPSHSDNTQLKKNQGVILPALPLTHVQHAQSSHAGNSIEDIVALRKSRFSSVPDFRSTTDILKHVRQKEMFKPSMKHHHRSRSLGVLSLPKRGRQQGNRQAEVFKKQLTGLSEWMQDWEATQKAFLLLEVVKLCNKELLGYLVQCLYQRLQESRGVASLPDSSLIEIFSFLDPTSLCRAAQTCRRWNRVANNATLWKHHCYVLGRREGVGDLSKAMETASGFASTLTSGKVAGDDGHSIVDWKITYRELINVMSRIKELVVKRAREELESQLVAELEKAPKATSATIRQMFSLKDMLQILHKKSVRLVGSRPATTQDLVRSAPESATTRRRRLRAEKTAELADKERLEMERLLSSRYRHRTPGDRTNSSGVGSAQGPHVADADLDTGTSWTQRERVQLVEVALDTRPTVPFLPNPEGIWCLVLSGYLAGGSTPKPGKVQPLPLVRRLQPLQTTVHCLQFDQKKIVMGTADMEILVYDIRTGRHVQTLTGHKGSVQCLQYDSFKIVSGSWDTTCMVWDAVHFAPLKELRGHTDCVSCLQFDQDKLVTGSYDKSLRVWSTSTWDCVTVIGDAHMGPIVCMQFNHWVIASGSTDKCVKLWSPTAHDHIATLNHDATVTALQLSNFLLITASLTGGILLWNLETKSILFQMRSVGGASLTAMSMSAGKIYGAGSDGVLYEWDISTGTCVRTLTGHCRPLTCIWTGHDKIVSAGEDNTVCIWYSKKALIKEPTPESGEVFFTELPIHVITEHQEQTN